MSRLILSLLATVALALASCGETAENPCKPDAGAKAENPCGSGAENPCGAKNPCEPD